VIKVVTLSPSESFVTLNPDSATQTRGTMLNFYRRWFYGVFFGANSYEILSVTENRMVVRVMPVIHFSLVSYFKYTAFPGDTC
jgi:hypothetical protein